MYTSKTYRKLSWTHGLNSTGSQPFWILRSFLAFSTSRILMNSSYRMLQNNFKITVCHLDNVMIKTYKKIFSSLNGLVVRWRRNLMSRYETRNCFNIGFNVQNCSKLHKYDKGPGLNTLTWQSWVIVIAPPSGDRKLKRIASYSVRSEIRSKNSAPSLPVRLWRYNRGRSRPRLAGACEGPFNAACSFNWLLK